MLAAYENARQWSLAHPDGLRAILARAAKLSDAVAARTLERNNLLSGATCDRPTLLFVTHDIEEAAGGWLSRFLKRRGHGTSRREWLRAILRPVSVKFQSAGAVAARLPPTLRSSTRSWNARKVLRWPTLTMAGCQGASRSIR